MIIKFLNIGLPKKEMFHGKEFMTGMCKKPVTIPLPLTHLGFEGDGVGDLKHHGGSDKAVCVYSIDHYEYWENMLGIQMPDAAFGENFSVTDMNEEGVCIGDMYRSGTALVQVSQPRQPCSTLAARYGREDFVKLVVDSGRTGFYVRVLEEGRVKAGDGLSLVEKDSHRVSIAFANRIYHHDRKNREGIEKVLTLPSLSESWRKSFQELKDRA
ncbi:MAG TPA: MOSC domain-containing protein [Nitrospirota bacterium]|nr:MOSC domain-containing protein [Nitrospirota bacterium]